MSHAFSEFSVAVWHLAGHGAQKDRLKRACTLSLVRMRPNEVPTEARHLFEGLRQRLHDAPTLTSIALQQNIDRLDDHVASEIIDDVLRIFSTVARYQPPEPPPSMLAPLRCCGRVAV
ncbi:hypothetical protein [Pseudoduganella aquatica]|uniref:Uncharacterized protein n=1 Tax=Pseudoduganella aquatica TaxID=2660641 RepID=A0A7X4HGE0_9BURK|nr:hypothetical protein [Pseudoduganella aquatica]MYN10776.1 hypothetical protein [Pseudoduganella aquatica]